jgi:hypothetical protein
VFVNLSGACVRLGRRNEPGGNPETGPVPIRVDIMGGDRGPHPGTVAAMAGTAVHAAPVTYSVEDPFRADITARIDTDRTIENLGIVAAISKALPSTKRRCGLGSRDMRVATPSHVPGLAGTPARPTRRVLCFWASTIPLAHDAPDCRGYELRSLVVHAGAVPSLGLGSAFRCRMSARGVALGGFACSAQLRKPNYTALLHARTRG